MASGVRTCDGDLNLLFAPPRAHAIPRAPHCRMNRAATSTTTRGPAYPMERPHIIMCGVSSRRLAAGVAHRTLTPRGTGREAGRLGTKNLRAPQTQKMGLKGCASCRPMGMPPCRRGRAFSSGYVACGGARLERKQSSRNREPQRTPDPEDGLEGVRVMSSEGPESPRGRAVCVVSTLRSRGSCPPPSTSSMPSGRWRP